ncbi:D-glycero-beta-D-manno-heptose 1-phosphate adenylyltransferase [Microbacterium sp. Marseille-Q6965]|uniref:D-glycero-beta-D-manno-heptose 1-phosphate adenylyltransferase n=1 Tax=Microbacterium sp. Marseille-Q6965 TaxID=2965072 RepID=UPI0021B74AD5|nr:D-glycero-beta-D-manno-heptose 1-phosphate adenylyltransferase [Microbacterium sp. Marseille-Q6965]
MTDVSGIARRVGDAAPRVLVVGDVILDRWLRGGVRRLSREAPVPVVQEAEQVDCPGGAGNTAANLAALGARVRLVAAIGEDAEGAALRDRLAAAGVETGDLLVDGARPTASKTRVVGDDQILVRVDRARPGPAGGDRLLAAIAPEPGETLVICDYDGGLLDEEFARQLAARRPDTRIVVDAHDVARWAPLRPDLVTPNAGEAATLLGRALPEGPARADAVAGAATELLEAAGADRAVVTLDRDGTVLLERRPDGTGEATHRTRARPAPEHQATGAGDTFVAAATVALAVGAAPAEAVDFAQRAADVVVSRPGTAVCALGDLQPAASTAVPGTLNHDALRAALRRERERGHTIVFTNGCFDLLHLGHTAHLRQAKQLGDVLVVALNDDASVRRLKGPGRPVNPVEDRARVLEALESVDYVTVFREDSPSALLADLRPDIYAKGGDYVPEMLEETAVVRAYGGAVRILDFIPAHSTSEIVTRITQRAPLR